MAVIIAWKAILISVMQKANAEDFVSAADAYLKSESQLAMFYAFAAGRGRRTIVQPICFIKAITARRHSTDMLECESSLCDTLRVSSQLAIYAEIFLCRCVVLNDTGRGVLNFISYIS